MADIKELPDRITVLEKVDVQGGNGSEYPKPGTMIEMHYAGYLYDPKATETKGKGKKFDSSYDRGQPLASKIGIGRLIAGWDELVPQMSLGETATLMIPALKGYGLSGFPPVIPKDSDLIFQVQLVSIAGKRS